MSKPRKPCKGCGGPKPAGRARKLCDPCALTSINTKGQRLRPTHQAGELRRRYGISIDQYNAALVTQNGKCAVCYGTCGTGQRLCVDHDHATGKVRGLVCRRCNSGLGYLENAAWMAAAASFLATPPGVSAPGRCTPLLAAAIESGSDGAS